MTICTKKVVLLLKEIDGLKKGRLVLGLFYNYCKLALTS